MPAVYDVGEQISIEHQDRQFNVCYGSEEYGYPMLAPNLSLKDFNGFYNDNGFGSVFYVLMLLLVVSCSHQKFDLSLFLIYFKPIIRS